MLIFVAILAILASYISLGWYFAIQDLPNAWNRAREAWDFEDMRKSSVKTQTVGTVFLWPYLKPYRALNNKLERLVTAYDPNEIVKRYHEAEKRIQQLEKELGIGQ